MYTSLANQAIARWSSLAGPLIQRIKSAEEIVKKSLNLMNIEKSELEELRKKAEAISGTLRDVPL